MRHSTSILVNDKGKLDPCGVEILTILGQQDAISVAFGVGGLEVIGGYVSLAFQPALRLTRLELRARESAWGGFGRARICCPSVHFTMLLAR